MLLENSTKRKLQEDNTVSGCFFRQPLPPLAEFVAMQGWDFLVLDGEHGSLEARDIEDLSRPCELHGVQVSWVNMVADVEDVVTASKHQPRGQRGLTGSRQGGWGNTASPADFTASFEGIIKQGIESYLTAVRG